MRVVLDIDKLLTEGEITRDEYDRFKKLSVQETGSLALNIMIGFGVIATGGGALALLPSSFTAIVLGGILAVAGLLLTLRLPNQWRLLGSMLLLVGSITGSGGVITLTEGGASGFLIVTLVCAVAAIVANSVLLSILATLALSATVGAMAAYGHATYFVAIRQPTMTIALFSLVALATYHLSKRLAPNFERIAIAFSRTSLFMVNLGFWVGSLWGDSLWQQRDNWDFRSGAVIPDWMFVVGWAGGLLLTGVWAVNANKRWVVNLLAVFAAIHFYTQYFERLGANPGSILVAGLFSIAIALGFVWYNKNASSIEESSRTDARGETVG